MAQPVQTACSSSYHTRLISTGQRSSSPGGKTRKVQVAQAVLFDLGQRQTRGWSSMGQEPG